MAGRKKEPKRYVEASEVLSGRWTPAGYPFRYVVIWHSKEMLARFRHKMVANVLGAVELLEAQGWELVNTDESVSIAVLRRAEPTA